MLSPGARSLSQFCAFWAKENGHMKGVRTAFRFAVCGPVSFVWGQFIMFERVESCVEIIQAQVVGDWASAHLPGTLIWLEIKFTLVMH